MGNIAPALLEDLRKVLGETGLIEAAFAGPADSEGWIARPASTEEVAATMKLCHDAGQPVIPIGGRTGLVQALSRTGHELGLSLERMRAVEEIDPTSRTMTVQAGVPLQIAQEIAEEHGLMFPLDLGARGTATIGGNIATNAGGNRVLRWGMTRDMVIALEAVLADGTILPLQGKALKNNTGYDLKHLLIGSEGTLGIVTRAILRVRPKPKSENCAFVAIPNFETLTKFLSYMEGQSSGSLSSFEVLWSDYYEFITGDMTPHNPPIAYGQAYYVLVETMGADPKKDATDFEELLGEAFEQELIADAVIAKSESERHALWHIRDDVLQLWQLSPLFTFDVSLAIAQMDNYTSEIKRRFDETFDNPQVMIFGHLGDGNLHVIVAPGDKGLDTHHMVEEIIYDAIRSRNGSVSAEHGIGLEKKGYLSYSRNADEIALMRKIKQAFDPKGILNPGKIFDVD